MLPQSEFESPMFANGPAPVAISAITQDRALIGLLRSTIDPANDLILVTSEAELTPHLNSRRVSAALLDSMFIEGDLAGMAERLRATWPDLVLVVVGTAEEQSGFRSLRRRAQLTRWGGDCYQYCMLAMGYVDVVAEASLKPYDIQALMPIIRGAGGIVTTWDGGDASMGGRVIASGDARVHREAMTLLKNGMSGNLD